MNLFLQHSPTRGSQGSTVCCRQQLYVCWKSICSTFEDDTINLSFFKSLSCFDFCSPSHCEILNTSSSDMTMLLGNWTIPHLCSCKLRSQKSYGNILMAVYSIFPNISGKLTRLEQYERLMLSREVNLIGGKVSSLLQPSKFMISSLSRNPTESWISTKFSQKTKDNSFKIGKPDKSGVRVKNSHLSKFKTLMCKKFGNSSDIKPL